MEKDKHASHFDIEIDYKSLIGTKTIELSTGKINIARGSTFTFSAPHEMPQIRNGEIKQGEPGTANLAFYLANISNGSALATFEEQSSDPNHVQDHPYIEYVKNLSQGGLVIDLHMMKPRGFEVSLGLGPDHKIVSGLWEVLINDFIDNDVKVAVNYPFASKGQTVTAQLQRFGIPAIQIELDYSVFDKENEKHLAVFRSLQQSALKLKKLI